jgi:hypothetical protein
MTKTALCDLCLIEDKVTIAKYSTSTAVKGNRIAVCTNHRIAVKKIAVDTNQVMALISNATDKVNTLRV